MLKSKVSPYEVISQLRLPLMVLVTFAHSYGAVDEGYNLLGSGWDTYEMLKLTVSQTLVKVAMPMFFFMSGFLFFANIGKWSMQVYWQKIRRRAWTLLIPYLIWNVLMAVKLKTFTWRIFWVFWQEAGKQTDWLGGEQILTAPANMPLWFLRDLMVVTLLTPILYIALRRFGSWLLALLTLYYLSGVTAFTPGLSAYSLYFFTFGAYFGIRKTDFVESFAKVEKPAYISSALLALAMLLSYPSPAFSSLMLCFRLASIPTVVCLASRMLGITTRRIPKTACDASYFIFLAHYVFFMSPIDETFFDFFGTSTASLCVHYLACPLIKILFLVFAYTAYTKAKRIVIQRLE